MATLSVGSDRTNGASTNTGTDTNNTAAANTSQLCLQVLTLGREADKDSLDSISLIPLGLVSDECNSLSIAELEAA
ncbi:hypothetical protein DSM107003_12960 [Trichormus variabilis SAG 1403-4b]|uniref:Uncharacterized protein n=1 Tax=Trichormus variabilis SAG 1403-4b TaxID=447716 RepID=A0A3S1AD64_ANAVA|nr:hypothetical protein DSM107003_12960 [Trichormus variabilis SAG 1403-4b]